MAPNDIDNLIQARPFAPFRIHMSDGASFEIHDPRFAFVTRFAVYLGEDFDEQGWPESGRYLNIRQITRVDTTSDKTNEHNGR